MHRRLNSLTATVVALVAVGAALTVGTPASAAAGDDPSAIDVGTSYPIAVAYHDVGSWLFTVKDVGTRTTAPLTLTLHDNTEGLARAWDQVTAHVSQGTCSSDAAHFLVTCRAGTLAPGRTVTLAVGTRQSFPGRQAQYIGWLFSAKRGTDDPNLRWDERVGDSELLPVHGSLTAAVPVDGGEHIRGWAVDLAHPTLPLTLYPTIDGQYGAHVQADLARADVDRVEGVTGGHGFDAVVPVPRGTHRFCLTANYPGLDDDYDFGCRTVTR